MNDQELRDILLSKIPRTERKRRPLSMAHIIKSGRNCLTGNMTHDYYHCKDMINNGMLLNLCDDPNCGMCKFCSVYLRKHDERPHTLYAGPKAIFKAIDYINSVKPDFIFVNEQAEITIAKDLVKITNAVIDRLDKSIKNIIITTKNPLALAKMGLTKRASIVVSMSNGKEYGLEKIDLDLRIKGMLELHRLGYRVSMRYLTQCLEDPDILIAKTKHLAKIVDKKIPIMSSTLRGGKFSDKEREAKLAQQLKEPFSRRNPCYGSYLSEETIENMVNKFTRFAEDSGLPIVMDRIKVGRRGKNVGVPLIMRGKKCCITGNWLCSNEACSHGSCTGKRKSKACERLAQGVRASSDSGIDELINFYKKLGNFKVVESIMIARSTANKIKCLSFNPIPVLNNSIISELDKNKNNPLIKNEDDAYLITTIEMTPTIRKRISIVLAARNLGVSDLNKAGISNYSLYPKNDLLSNTTINKISKVLDINPKYLYP